MTRYTFGGNASDYAVMPPSTMGGVLRSFHSATGGTCWSAKTGGTQYTDLIAVAGGAPVCTDQDGYVYQFQGPDGVTDLWVDLGTGERFHLLSSDPLTAVLGAGYIPDPATPATTLGQTLGYDSGQPNNVRWFTSQESAARALGWVIATDSRWAGGADPTGATDSTTAIQAAINSLTSGRGTVFFPPGTYLHNGLTISQNGISLVGCGPYRSVLRCDHASNDMIAATSVSLLEVRNLQLESTSTGRTAGNVFNFNQVQQYRIADVKVDAGPKVGNFIQCQIGYLSNVVCVSSTTPAVGDQWFFQKCTSTFLSDVSVNLGSNVLDSSSAQYHFDSGNDTIRLANVNGQASTNGGGRGIWFTNTIPTDPTYGFAPRWVRMVDCYLEAATGLTMSDARRQPALQIDAVLDLRVVDSYAFSSLQGVQVNGGIGVFLTGVSCVNNSNEGVQINGGTYITLNKVVCSDNSQVTTNTYSGVYVSSAVSGYVDVLECVFTDAYRGYTNKQKYGLENYGSATTQRGGRFVNLATSAVGGTVGIAAFRGVSGDTMIEFTGSEQVQFDRPVIGAYANGSSRDFYMMLGNSAGAYRFFNVGATSELARLSQDGTLGFFDVGSSPSSVSGQSKFFSQSGHPMAMTSSGQIVDLSTVGSVTDQNLLVARNFDPLLASAAGNAFTSGTGVLLKLPVLTATAITNLLVYVSTAGSSLTSGECLVGLYDHTGAQIGATPDQSSVWTSVGLKTMALTTPTGTRTPGEFLYVLLITNGTTNPTFRSLSASPMDNAGLTATSGLRFAAYSSGLTALPSTITLSSATSLTTSIARPWVGAN